MGPRGQTACAGLSAGLPEHAVDPEALHRHGGIGKTPEENTRPPGDLHGAPHGRCRPGRNGVPGCPDPEHGCAHCPADRLRRRRLWPRGPMDRVGMRRPGAGNDRVRRHPAPARQPEAAARRRIVRADAAQTTFRPPDSGPAVSRISLVFRSRQMRPPRRVNRDTRSRARVPIATDASAASRESEHPIKGSCSDRDRCVRRVA